MAESVFVSLECELIDRHSFETKTEARLAVFARNEAWYNPRRRHSAVGRISSTKLQRIHATPHILPHPYIEPGLPNAGLGMGRATSAVDNPTQSTMQT